jgi:hypothetical protein
MHPDGRLETQLPNLVAERQHQLLQVVSARCRILGRETRDLQNW